jgi:hypothetical protein
MTATVTPLHKKPSPGALRQRRFRKRRKAAKAVTSQRNGRAVTTAEICSLGSTLIFGSPTREELIIIDRLLMVLNAMLPRDGAVFLED